MKRLAVLVLTAALALSARAGSFNAQQASFDELLNAVYHTGSTPGRVQRRDVAQAELERRGAATLSNLMTRIHLENLSVNLLAINLVAGGKVDTNEAAVVLLSFTKSDRMVTRRTAAYLLGFLPVPRYADDLRPLLADPDVRGAAARTLGKWRITNAVPDIMPLLKDPKERVRIVAANALRDIGDRRALQPLIAALGDPVYTVRNTAARALVSFGAETVEPLGLALRGASDPAKRQIIRCLGDIRSKNALRHLRPLLKDGDYDTRRDAVRAIEQIQGLRAGGWFDEKEPGA